MSDPDILSQSEIDNLLSSLAVGLESTEEIRRQDNIVLQDTSMVENMSSDEDKKGYKLYNFRRPDKFSKDHLRALHDIHKEFSRQLALILTAYLRMHIDIDVVSVDQLTYDEFARSMPNPITIGILELNPLPGQVLLGMSHEVTSSIVDRMLGGTGVSETKARELTDIEEALSRRVLDKITKTLEEAWKTVLPAQGAVVGIDSNYTLIQITSPGEIVALVTLEIQIAGRHSGLMSVCFPYPVLESVLSQLSAQHIFQTKGMISTAEDKQKILSRLGVTNMHVNVILGGVDITVKDLFDLKIGDVLRLDNLVRDNLVVKVNDIPKFLARPGTHNGRVAVSVTDIVDENDYDD
ncbi:MAG: Flagellar motor switch protein FliM [uncultured bacterium]|nr:MAG: Flagellar motor switch protein FliM [uncultured bacterium]HBH17906.1 flagellar motor switch protein FliM [Cyanobacteria bacterium UBA9579]